MKNSNGGNAGREVEPTDMPNKSEMLITVLIESEDPHSGETPRVYLGGMRMRADDTNGPGCRPDGLRGQADGSTAQTDAPSASNRPEMVVVSHSDGAGTYLSAGDAKRGVTKMNSDRDGNDGDGDGTTSGGSVDLNRVNAMLLAAESQHTRQTQRMRDGNSPVSPVPPIYHAERPYGIVTRRR